MIVHREVPIWLRIYVNKFLHYNTFKFLIIQYNVFPSIKKYVIDPYYEAHPEEDIEKRRNLGIEVETDEEETEEDDTVFND